MLWQARIGGRVPLERQSLAPLLARGSAARATAVCALLVVGFLGIAFTGGAALARSPMESFADLVEKLRPAVVNIATTSKPDMSDPGSEPSPFEELPPGAPFEDFFDFFDRRIPDGDDGGFQPVTSLGSGFIIDPRGYVVTNNHVIAGADEIAVVLSDNTRLSAEVVGRDPKTDLALLKVATVDDLPYVEFGDSDSARVGDWVIAIGNPFGLGNTVTAGIVSARGRDINAGPYDDFLQTDAPINRGNSGGPMFDMSGKVIGVNTLIYSPSGGSVGIGFATPTRIVRPVIDQLLKYGRTRRGWLGVRIQSVSLEIAETLGLTQATGALVAAVIEDGPAERGALRQGDVILNFDGQLVPSRRSLPKIVADTEVGKAVDVVIWRDGGERVMQIEVGRLEDYELASIERARQIEAEEQSFEALGVTLAAITPELRQAHALDDDIVGVLVTGVAPEVEREIDIQPGDVIVEVGHEAVVDLDDVRRRLESLADSASNLVVILRLRDGNSEFVAMEIRGS